MKNKESNVTKEFKKKFIAESEEIILNVSPIIEGKMINSVMDSLILLSAKTIVKSFDTKEKVTECGMVFVEKFMMAVKDCFIRKEEKAKDES